MRWNCWWRAATSGARDDVADPEAWVGSPLLNEERQAFYEYHAILMEPWMDRPPWLLPMAANRVTLDRNGCAGALFDYR